MGPPPANAYAPGTVLTVGSHQAMIVKYISQGGFAHVYLVKVSPLYQNQEIACLKRVLVPNKATLNILRAEVDAMKRLRGRPYIVSYIDSHAARSPNNDGTYEVFLLMEYCSKNGLIDFLNSRLQNRLTEAEVLDIMYQVSIGLSQVHFLNPPLIHRDIKIENILINAQNQYRLCDFGSSCPPLRPPRNPQELQILQNDILKYTTAQYRSPEMIDLSRGLPIDEKSDIWALGVFCYKICYYTTPFEHSGESAILQSKFSFPNHPVYSPRLQNLIKVLLTNDARARPNIYQVLDEVCKMKNVPIPFEIQQQYIAHKQQKVLIQQQQQQQLLLNQQQQQQAQPVVIPQQLTSSNSKIIDTISGQSSGAALKSYNDSLSKSTTSIKSVKSGKSVQSVQSGISFQSVQSQTSAKSIPPNNIVPPDNVIIKPTLKSNQSKSTSALSSMSSKDPFYSLLEKNKSTTATNSAKSPPTAPNVTPFKVVTEKENGFKQPKRPTPSARNSPISTRSSPDLSLEVIDVDMKGLQIKFDGNKNKSSGNLVKPDDFKSPLGYRSNYNSPNLTGSKNFGIPNHTASKNGFQYPKLESQNTSSRVGSTSGQPNELRRSQSFHKRTISAGKTSLNKLTSSLTGKFRSSSNSSTKGGKVSRNNTGRQISTNNTGRKSSLDFKNLAVTRSQYSSSSSEDVDKSEEELISEISMKEFNGAEYLKKAKTDIAPVVKSQSVQKRMELLMNNKDNEPIVKTATGYGKYTDDDNKPKVKVGLKKASTGTIIRPKSSIIKTPPIGTETSLKKKKVPPPRPKKPSHLISPKIQEKDWNDSKKDFLQTPTGKSKHKRDNKDENAFFEDDGIIDDDDDFDVNNFEKSFNEKFPKI